MQLANRCVCDSMRCIFDVNCVILMMLIYNVNCVLLDDHDHDDVSDFECVL